MAVSDDIWLTQGGGSWFTGDWSAGVPTSSVNAIIESAQVNASDPVFIQGQAAFADDVTLGDGVFSDVLAIGGAVGSSLTAKNVNVSNFSELIIGGAFLGGPGQS
jgi:hypothetical protein